MHPSPLRSISNQHPTSPAFHELVKDATVMRQDLNQKEYELYEQERLQRHQTVENAATVQAFSHQVQTLEGDKVQWIKKMNALLVEKDRITQEKMDLAAQVQEARLRCDDLERRLSQVGRKQASEKLISSDLKAEKEENSRLRDVIRALEVERAELRSKIREYEINAAGFGRERVDTSSKIQQKQDHISLLESDNRALQEQIRNMKIQVSDFDLERTANAHDRSNLRETISRLEADKSEALVRISELNARHENYIAAVNNEKGSIEWMHRRQIRLHASRTIGKTLQEVFQRRTNRRFSDLKIFRLAELRKKRETFHLIWKVVRLSSAAKKSAVDRWRDCLNWRHTAGVRDGLLIAHWKTRMSSLCFQAWKSLSAAQISDRQQKSGAIRNLFSRYLVRVRTHMRKRLFQWQGRNRFMTYRNKCLHAIVHSGSLGKMSHALHMWRAAMHQVQREQAKEDVATVLSSTLLTQAVLSGWKTVAARSRAKEMMVRMQLQSTEKLHQAVALHGLNRYLEKKKEQNAALSRVIRRVISHQTFLSFERWKTETRDKKQSHVMAKMFTRQHYKRYMTVLEKIFYAWKSLLLSEKLESLRSRYEEEVPRRQQLEADLHQTLVDRQQAGHIAVIRLMGKQLSGQIRPFLRQWRNVVVRMRTTQPTMRRFLLVWFWKKQEMAFTRWKEGITSADLANLYEKHSSLQEENAALSEHVGNLEQVLQHLEEEKTGITHKRLSSVLKLSVQFQLKDALRKWGKTALEIMSKRNSSQSLLLRLTEIVYFRTFEQLKHFTVKRRKAEIRKTRLRHFYMKTWKNTLSNTFAEWAKFSLFSQSRKRVLNRIVGMRNSRLEAGAVEMWSRYVLWCQRKEGNRRQEELLKKHSELTDAVTGLTHKLDLETSITATLQETMTRQAQMLLANSMVRTLTNGLFRSFEKWKTTIRLQAKQLRKTEMLPKLFEKQVLRVAMRRWQLFSITANSNMLLEQISISQRKQKETQKVLKSVQEELDTTIEEKTRIEALKSREIDVLEVRLDGLLSRAVRDQRNEYSMSKAGYVFKFWSNRYQVLKSGLQNLLVVAHRSILKSALQDIKTYSKEVQEYALFKRVVTQWLHGYGKRHTKHGFELWRLKTRVSKREELRSMYEMENARGNFFQTNLISMKEKAAHFAGENVSRTQRSKILNGWKTVAGTLRKCRVANGNFKGFSRLTNLQLGLTCLKENKHMRQRLLTIVETANRKRFCFIKRVILLAFHKNAVILKRFQRTCTKLEKVTRRERQIVGFSALTKSSVLTYLQTTHFESAKSASLRRIIIRLNFSRVHKSLHMWKAQGVVRRFTHDRFRTTMSRALYRKYTSALQLWKEHRSFISLSQYFTLESPLATENSMLKHRTDILFKLMREEGFDERYIEKYVMERESLAEALKWKGIARMRYAAGMTIKSPDDQTLVLPRALLTWKVWVSKRKKVRRLATRMRAYRSHPCMWAFHTWKHGLPLVRSTLASFTRSKLISLIAKMDRDIKTMETMVEDHNKRLSYLKIYSNLLEQHTRRGRNQSLLVLNRQVHNPLAQTLTRWTRAVTAMKLTDLTHQIVSLDDTYHVLSVKYEQLEQEYSIIFSENNELRQATLDGLDLADAIETLSKERERLSVDLADRAATIKELLEENNELASRLRAAQKEAETLRIQTAPERDGRFESLKRM